MENQSEQRTKKASKKGSKATKAKSDEEEARRREVLSESLRGKLDLETRALQVVERLLADSVPEDFLIDCAKFIIPANYRDVIEERSIAKQCGYPICPNKLGKVSTQQFKISTMTNKCFCSNFCYKASKEFELKISTGPLWLRHHESPPQITLMKKGDGGSSGEEVRIAMRCVQEDDIENPAATAVVGPPSLPRLPGAPVFPHSDDSDDGDQEQGFVSGMATAKRPGPRVHWGELPTRTDEDGGQKERQNTREEEEESRHPNVESGNLVEQTAPVDNLPADVDLNSNFTESEPRTESPPTPDRDTSQMAPPGLNVTRVGMSKQGAAGLRELLLHHHPRSFRENLMESLRRTLSEWRSEETRTFLYSQGPTPLQEEQGEEDEGGEEDDLDEDDFEVEEVVVLERRKRPSAPAPDYDTLRRQTQEQEIRVQEFYQGSRVLPGDTEQPAGDTRATSQGQETRDPVLPLVDSQAQVLIQKRIV
ncbi:hypothetical protein NHX12_005028 [Muraenolepis orangiensis]|uniref:RNA polymerase II subunit B1 CTD phosphatase RPAP2 homolog n=1 Tax=Muraenolepis orangiensis TaxID=630683 RepID=A0A9Q0DVL7_9TELE|nr:hypothetical protein NHX12_005028 [Muraenolepis orangiensis]